MVHSSVDPVEAVLDMAGFYPAVDRLHDPLDFHAFRGRLIDGVCRCSNDRAGEQTSGRTPSQMHVLMLGWEFPPFITGGLGTACQGLTRALDRREVEVTFVLPRAVGDQTQASHVRLVSPATAVGAVGSDADEGAVEVQTIDGDHRTTETRRTRFVEIPSSVTHPYPTTSTRHVEVEVDSIASCADSPAADPKPPSEDQSVAEDARDYDGDLMAVVDRYARFCLAACGSMEFDVIHAHDWLTYEAGVMLAAATGKPLVVHVHSTEFDRSGEHVNQRLYDIERRGMHAATAVVTVSHLTRNVVINRYGVDPERVTVVYNGVELETTDAGLTPIDKTDRIVLYFGRITYQKGPDYFLRAASRVLEVMDDVKFVVAGSGDLAASMIQTAASMGIGHKVLFTGFLRGRDIQRIFSLADLYVMPSVSEPFGIAPLEAMGHDVPVLISRSSGVSEVLTHALKVDFWDIDDMANKIIAVLRHPPLGRTLQKHGRIEARRLTWDGAAERCVRVYDRAIATSSALAGTP